MMQHDEALAKLWSMIKDIRVAMMTSWDGEEMHSRPMHGHQKEFSGKLYFFTKLASGKTDEIRRHLQRGAAGDRQAADNVWILTVLETWLREFDVDVAADMSAPVTAAAAVG